MILTGKCKEDFLVWYFNSYLKEDKYCLIKDVERFFETKKKLFQNTLIIDFFDSVDMIINVKRYVMPLGEVEWYFIITGDNGAHLNNHVSEESRSIFDCRKNITEQAIKKANEIYNETALHNQA